jgi:starch phosphorylase
MTLGTTEKMTENIRRIPDKKIWQFRNAALEKMIRYTRERLSRELVQSGASSEEIKEAKQVFSKTALTLGFARRFATYKRPNLLLHDPQRLLNILSNTERPVQLIIAGKAHPQDKPGQDLIKEWINFIRRPEARKHAVFLSDYDMFLTQELVKGVDVWINTPRRPWEASGTSGMKVLVNGGINLSELDGWWAEAFSPEVGWALGDGDEHGDDQVWDDKEANDLYSLLEDQIIPEYYERDTNGIPKQWVNRIRESMALLTPHFSVNRTVREYTEKHYIPAASNFKLRTTNNGIEGKKLVEWEHRLSKDWDKIHFGETRITTKGEQHLFEVDVYLSDIELYSIKVELYADSVNSFSQIRQEMKPLGKSASNSSYYTFEAGVSSSRPETDYTPSVMSTM